MSCTPFSPDKIPWQPLCSITGSERTLLRTSQRRRYQRRTGSKDRGIPGFFLQLRLRVRWESESCRGAQRSGWRLQDHGERGFELLPESRGRHKQRARFVVGAMVVPAGKETSLLSATEATENAKRQ